jgi:hypothetical protein
VTAGYQPNQTQINTLAGQYAVALRNDFQNVVNLNGYVTAMGGATFLEGLGFTNADAATLVSTLGNLATLASIYQGGTQESALNYDDNSQALWGGN